MMLRFQEVRLGDVVELSGRVGKADAYRVVWKHNDRIKLEWLVTKGELKYLTENQFNDAGFVGVVDRNVTG